MLKFILYIFLVALLHAKLETMIEGQDGGWAKKLPCWRLNVFLIKLIIGKELTGYHCYLMLLFLTLFHSPLLFIEWTLQAECFILGLFCFYWILEDWLWFVLNKHWGLKKFKKDCIPWHLRWAFGVPISYWISAILGVIFLSLGGIQ